MFVCCSLLIDPRLSPAGGEGGGGRDGAAVGVGEGEAQLSGVCPQGPRGGARLHACRAGRQAGAAHQVLPAAAPGGPRAPGAAGKGRRCIIII
eukprot:1078568-Prorocentrum_minimum.AAC.1